MVASTAIVATMDDETKGNNLVIAAHELLQFREKICKLYFKQKVIVAPCLSKLFFYCEKETSDRHELKSTSNWMYSATGLIAVIYDEELNDVKLTLFDRHSAHLHWCLKWADFINCQMPSPNFQIINTEADSHQHVGILYENKDVAELIARTVSLFYASIKLSVCKDYKNEKTFPLNTKTKLRATQSDALLKMSKHSSFDEKYKPKEKKHEIRRSSLRGSLPRKWGQKVADEFRRKDRSASLFGNANDFAGLIAHRAINKGVSERPVSNCTDEATRISLFSRADTFRRNRSQSMDATPNKEIDTEFHSGNGKEKRQKSIGDTTHKESMIKLLFKKRRISRSQSLKNEDESSSSRTTKEGDRRKPASDYERPVRLTKPRSLTEPIILKDDNKILIESALAARQERERKRYVKNLTKAEMPTTNLCDTDL